MRLMQIGTTRPRRGLMIVMTRPRRGRKPRVVCIILLLANIGRDVDAYDLSTPVTIG